MRIYITVTPKSSGQALIWPRGPCECIVMAEIAQKISRALIDALGLGLMGINTYWASSGIQRSDKQDWQAWHVKDKTQPPWREDVPRIVSGFDIAGARRRALNTRPPCRRRPGQCRWRVSPLTSPLPRTLLVPPLLCPTPAHSPTCPRPSQGQAHLRVFMCPTRLTSRMSHNHHNHNHHHHHHHSNLTHQPPCRTPTFLYLQTTP